MSPRYSNVTTSIRGIDYTICITQSQIHLFKATERTSKSAPKFLPESQSDKITSKGKLNPLQEGTGGETS